MTKNKLDPFQIIWTESADDIEQKIKNNTSEIEYFSYWLKDDKQLIKIKTIEVKTFLSPNKITYPIGKVLICPQNEICIQCGNDFLLIKSLQIEGEKPMQSEKFIQNYPEFIGAVLQ
ncbi:MAG: hypothetical protein HF967_01285 [Methanosarcinales archaeon]|nr:hypothetical protein [Methanosarcinales archaeon]